MVDREQLRVRMHGRQYRKAEHLKGLLEATPTPPPTPSSWDYTKSGSIHFPCYANGPPYPNPVGDCYYEAVIHYILGLIGNSGDGTMPVNVQQLVQRYEQLSGGDNGLADQDIMPEWLGGIVGPNGPAKILDWMTVDFNNLADWQDAFFQFGGLIWTCSLLDTWLNQDSPGSTWGASGRPDPSAGHAMHLPTRKGASGPTLTNTWGIEPQIQVTDAGFKAADSEFIVVFAQDQFKQDGTCAFTGMSWEDKRQLWKARGGKDVGPSPFGPTPPAPVPPTPPVVQGYEVTIPSQQIVVPGLFGRQTRVTVPGGTYPCTPVSSQRKGALWDALWKLIDEVEPIVSADVEAGKTWEQVVADVTQALTQNKSAHMSKFGLTPQQWQNLLALLLQLLPLIVGG